jgi:YidC/Oxa1 family membrane protein insertase
MIWDTLLNGLGAVLSFFYGVVPSYGGAIILLTIAVRVVMLPLTIKQTRSMQAMQRIQPKVKELQRKYKGNRQKLNEELMKLYKEHQVNPLGGCLPLVLQLPVFFALYSVLRATLPAVAVPAEPVPASEVTAEGTVCNPAGQGPTVEGAVANQIVCEAADGTTRTFTVEGWRDEDTSEEISASELPFLFTCVPRTQEEPNEDQVKDFLCQSPIGTGHIPADDPLFEDIVEDRARFLGMELACSPTQAASEEGIRICARPGTQAGGFPLVGYFGLVALMVLTTYYSQRQMQRASVGPQAQQMQLLGRIMPVFLGFISISIPTGVLVYWVTTNAWQIGQQTLMLRSRDKEAGPPGGDGRPPSKDAGPAKKAGEPKAKPGPSAKSGDAGKPAGGSSKKSGGRNARGRKKRTKR